MAFVSVTPVGKVSSRSVLASSFSGRRIAVARSVRAKVTVPRMGVDISDGESFDSNPVVLLLALAGWIIPSSIPTNIPLLKGTGLTQAFFASISDNLSRWPRGPALDDPFWVLLSLWHLGLFATLIFGSIGYNANKQGMFK
mmetsp:Transcript_230/g.733  ORF Transcript_230/g.733 Transcript_230/m.733 type:complete len:141 (+) Transcript_230:148-570(+)|eukprot:CAMPEP_0198725452 /NCGR_PEP_ID=MMETSP1475-20131203/2745_1 /TAXON_ID= ORGANISM="Unidentified sp., Strain CCMP1999" /NCGR_SAMPLE_ID=MMETSP1475 /ASSEMBLY_ACC=CAM_ASM_001111 /LENGTH=140 /DNA_ID=CAMNT_0044487237 /DNA_START=124 /DNA_END=546 /DNA_ORIENTATION=+